MIIRRLITWLWPKDEPHLTYEGVAAAEPQRLSVAVTFGTGLTTTVSAGTGLSTHVTHGTGLTSTLTFAG